MRVNSPRSALQQASAKSVLKMLARFLLYLTIVSGAASVAEPDTCDRDGGCTQPRGHMEPLGNHRDPDDTLATLDQLPSPDVFLRDYVLARRPAVLR
jgi:hypothetical protein